MSRSLPIFTELERIFYKTDHFKRIPEQILKSCTLPHFLATLYVDEAHFLFPIVFTIDRIKFISHHIYSLDTSFSKLELENLKDRIIKHFKVNLDLSKRSDGMVMY